MIDVKLPNRKRNVVFQITPDMTVSELLQKISEKYDLDKTKNWVLVCNDRELDSDVLVLSNVPSDGVYVVDAE